MHLHSALMTACAAQAWTAESTLLSNAHYARLAATPQGNARQLRQMASAAEATLALSVLQAAASTTLLHLASPAWNQLVHTAIAN
jgi:hypothetical protein